MFSKSKTILAALAMAGLVVACAKSNVRGRLAKRSAPVPQAGTNGGQPANPSGTPQQNPPPYTDTSNSQPPFRELYYTVTFAPSFAEMLNEQYNVPETGLCAQIVNTNNYLMFEASPGPCPTDGNGNQTLADYSTVFATLLMGNANAQGQQILWDEENPVPNLGAVSANLGASPPTYYLTDLCTGAYSLNADETDGCSLGTSGSQVTGLGEAQNSPLY